MGAIPTTVESVSQGMETVTPRAYYGPVSTSDPQPPRSEERDQALFDELHRIREELHGLREAFEKRGMKDEIDQRISELEVEQRLYEIEQEIVGENEKAARKRRRFWRR